MTVVRRVARPLLSVLFVRQGLDALRHPGARASTAAPFVARIAKPLGLPDDPELLVRANGVAMLGAGSLLAMGRFPRLASLVLVGTMVPTTFVGHAFWTVKDAAARKQQRIQFDKNLGLIGGLLIAAVDTEGKPSLAWRAQHAVKDVRRTSATTTRGARRLARSARREAKLATVQAQHTLS